jgi:hypothetical protein
LGPVGVPKQHLDIVKRVGRRAAQPFLCARLLELRGKRIDLLSYSIDFGL